MRYLTALWEAFRFLHRYRQRRDAREAARRAELAAERAHQLAMLTTTLEKLVEMNRANAEPILELARAQQGQNELFANWLKGFHITNPEPMVPQIADNLAAENERAELAALVNDLPPEFALAFALREQEREDEETE